MLLRKPLLVAVLAIVALGAAACGSPAASEGGDSAAGGSTAEAETVAKALGINLSDCATDPTERLPAEVKVGQTLAQSGGPATTFAPIGAALKASYQNFNDTGDFPTKFSLVQSDDQFAPDKALTATQELIAQEQVAGMTVTIGTPQVIAVREILNTECVPMIGAASGGARANAPQQFPWTIPFTEPSAVDARIWVEDLAAKNPGGVKVAMFYANDASGKEFLEVVKKYLAETKSTLVATQTVENTDSASPASQVTTLRNSGATVLLAAPTGAQCAPLMKEVASQGWKPAFYMSSTCPATLFDLAGAAADGVFVNAYVKDPSRAPYDTDSDVQNAIAQLEKYSPGTPVNNTSMSGFVYAEPFFEAARQAAKSPLGLSRLGLLEAATHMSFQPALALPGIRYQLDYPSDQVAMEAAQLQQYVASSKTFTKIKIYDFEGQMTGTASTP